MDIGTINFASWGDGKVRIINFVILGHSGHSYYYYDLVATGALSKLVQKGQALESHLCLIITIIKFSGRTETIYLEINLSEQNEFQNKH